MIKRILTGSVAASAVTMSDRIAAASGNHLMIGIGVGGSGHVEADFSAHVVNATLRQRGGDDRQLISGLKVGAAMKVADYIHGFSLQSAGDSATRYVLVLPIGRLRLEGDDVLEVSYAAPGDATATYAVVVSLVDLVKGPETLIGYEMLIGNSGEQLVKNAHAIYLVTASTGAAISVADQFGANTTIDLDMIDLANGIGEIEVYEAIGLVYVDQYKFSQDVRVKLPTNAEAVAVKEFFDPARLNSRMVSDGIDEDSLKAKIRSTDAVKYRALEMLGRV